MLSTVWSAVTALGNSRIDAIGDVLSFPPISCTIRIYLVFPLPRPSPPIKQTASLDLLPLLSQGYHRTPSVLWPCSVAGRGSSGHSPSPFPSNTALRVDFPIQPSCPENSLIALLFRHLLPVEALHISCRPRKTVKLGNHSSPFPPPRTRKIATWSCNPGPKTPFDGGPGVISLPNQTL